jgi:Carboxypeptidase regulatory-like domain
MKSSWRFTRELFRGAVAAYLLVATIAFLAGSTAATAQTLTTGDVAGSITDPTGAVIPGATVLLANMGTGTKQTTTTNDSGVYRITFLPPGRYTVTAQAAGLKAEVAHITVQVGQVTTLNLTAQVQATQTVVEVNETTTVVDTENANLARTFAPAQIQDLPAPGGDITTVAFTVPGIAINTGGGYGNFSSHGLPGTANLFTINGNDYNDPYLNLNNSGASNLLLGQNETAEASVVQNAYSVQYGRNAGAQVTYVTKSGTNEFHGNLAENWNGTALNANDFFNNLNGLPRPHAISNNYAASFGGRVIRDKLFFFTDTEGLRYVLPASADVAFPSPQLQAYAIANAPASATSLYQAAFSEFSGVMSKAQPVTNGGGPLQDGNGTLGCGADFAGTAAPGSGIFGQTVPCAYAFATNASNTNTEWLMTDRVDWNVNDKHRLYFRFKTDHGKQPTGTNVVDPVFNVQSVQPQYEGQVNYTYAISPTMVNNFIGSVLWYSALFTSPNLNAASQALPVDIDILNAGINGSPVGYYPIGFGYQPFGVVDLGYNIFPQGRRAGQLGIVDDFSWVVGRHNIKIGTNLRRNRVTDFTPLENAYGSYIFNSLSDFANGVTNPATGSLYSQTFAPVGAVHIRLYNIGVYAQDEWNVSNNLKVTYGLRLEHTGNPLCLDDCFSRLNVPFASPGYQGGADVPYNASITTGLSHTYPASDAIEVLPRIGVVWSPRGPNSTVIRTGFGLFADLPPGNLALNVFENLPYIFPASVSGGQAVGSPAAGTALAEYNAFKTGFANGATLTQLEAAIPGFGPSTYFSTPNHLYSPKYAEWSFEVEQPLGQKNVFVATYSGNHGYNELLTSAFGNVAYNAANFPNGFGGLPATVPDPRFSAVNQLLNSGYSNYDGLTVQFRRAFSSGFQGQVGYTWSHALDTLTSLPGEPFNYSNSVVTLNTPSTNLNYSNADTDIRQNLVADFTWDLPWKPDNRMLASLLGNWTLASKFYVRSGAPFSVTDGALPGLISSSLPAVPANQGPVVLMAEPLSGVATHCGTSAINTPCFTAANFVPSGQETNWGAARNSFYGPGYFDMDTSLYKYFPITEHMKFMFGAQAYNLFNHPNFANPGGNIAGGLGTITSTVSPPTSPYGAFQGSAVSGRVMVLSGRFQF